MDSRILYKYTSRSRPANFFRGLDSIKNRSVSDNYQVLCSFDLDDLTMNNEEVIERLKGYKNVSYIFGHSKNKIDAINRDMDKVEGWDILVNMSDDMVFIADGFDDEIRNAFDSDDLMVNFNDGNQKDNVCTMSIISKKYYDRFNYIYHPEYVSLWCDCEATDVARILGKYKYMGDDNIIFRHLHPSFGLCRYDEQYMKTESHELRSKDQITYDQRRAKNFEL